MIKSVYLAYFHLFTWAANIPCHYTRFVSNGLLAVPYLNILSAVPRDMELVPLSDHHYLVGNIFNHASQTKIWDKVTKR